MQLEVRLPQWGMGMTNGTIAEWVKNVGDLVTEGEPIARVETEKVTADLEAPATGVLKEIKAGPGSTVEIFAVVAVIETA